MKSPMQVISDLGIPTESVVEAVQHVQCTEDGHYYNAFGPMTIQQYEEMITEIMGLETKPSYDTWKIARIHFGYTIQETITAFNSGSVPDMEQLWDIVNAKAEKFMKENPWAVKEFTTENESDDEDGKPKLKKGAKKEMSKKVWDDNPDKQTTMSRKEWIALLCEKVEDMTPAGASTYYANLKNGKI